MTKQELKNLTDSLTKEYEQYKDDLTIKGYIKRVIEITNLYWQEKSVLNIADVMLSFLNFVQEQKPTMVNHGEKINLFELERLVEKFKNRV